MKPSCAMLLCAVCLLGGGCSMIPTHTGPRDPFALSAPGPLMQRRARPRVIPPTVTSPAESTESTREEAAPIPPKRKTPKTFVDPDPVPTPTSIPPQKTRKVPISPPAQDKERKLDGPALVPMDEADHSVNSVNQRVSESSDAARLDLRVQAPERCPVGGGAPLQLSIRNLSEQTIRNISVVCEFDENLRFPGSNRQSVTHKIPRIESGDEKESSLTLVSDISGKHQCQFAVMEGSKVVLRKTVAVEFISREIDWQIQGPTERTVGSRAEFNIPIMNVSRQALRGLTVRVDLDAALTVREMTKGGKLDERSVTWDIDQLAANEGQVLQLEVECREPTIQACLQVHVSGGGLPEDTQEALLIVQARSSTLGVQVQDMTDPVQVGQDTEMIVTIQNEGIQTTKDVTTTCTWPEGLEFVGATVEQHGKSRAAIAEVDQNTARFAPLAKLAPNQAVKYRVVLKGQAPGSCRVQFEVRAGQNAASIQVMEPVLVHP